MPRGDKSKYTDKRIAEDIAESVSGVKNVQNQLRVGGATRTDETTVATPQARAAKQQ